MAARYTIKAYILHAVVFKNGEVYAILPPNALPEWAALAAEMYPGNAPF